MVQVINNMPDIMIAASTVNLSLEMEWLQDFKCISDGQPAKKMSQFFYSFSYQFAQTIY